MGVVLAVRDVYRALTVSRVVYATHIYYPGCEGLVNTDELSAYRRRINAYQLTSGQVDLIIPSVFPHLTEEIANSNFVGFY